MCTKFSYVFKGNIIVLGKDIYLQDVTAYKKIVSDKVNMLHIYMVKPRRIISLRLLRYLSAYSYL